MDILLNSYVSPAVSPISRVGFGQINLLSPYLRIVDEAAQRMTLKAGLWQLQCASDLGIFPFMAA